jgi:hypothetical protein
LEREFGGGVGIKESFRLGGDEFPLGREDNVVCPKEVLGAERHERLVFLMFGPSVSGEDRECESRVVDVCWGGVVGN